MRHTVLQMDSAVKPSHSSICANVTGTESRRSYHRFPFVQYGRLHGAGYQQAVILWSLVLDDRRTIRAHDSSDIRNVSGTIESALSVAAEICANFFS